MEGCKPNINERKSLMLNGIVVEKFSADNMSCFGSIVISSKGKLDTINDICICVLEHEELWQYLHKGDSLSKEYGSLVWKVFRAKKTKEFNYPSCYK
jgi:hypothetical protein